MLTFHIITLFPEAFDSYLATSIIGRAIKQQQIKIKFYHLRDFTPVKNSQGYTQVDDRPYGGGPGMVLQAAPILRAVARARAGIKGQPAKVIIFSPVEKQFTNQLGRRWAKRYRHLILICGRYEGIDARVKKILRAVELSIGPYVLTGGELPALVVLDAISRQLPGVLGRAASVEEERGVKADDQASHEVYTRPASLVYAGKAYRVPRLLLSGHHRQIKAWRSQRASL